LDYYQKIHKPFLDPYSLRDQERNNDAKELNLSEESVPEEATVLPDDSHEKLMNEIRQRIKAIRSYTPKVGVFGNSGVGKSSLCNALFGKDIAKISDVEACTRKPQDIIIGAGNGKGGINLIDVPGIGEDPAHQEEYTALYKSLAPELDLVLWAIKADDRNYASGLDAYKEVFGNAKSPPVIFVITQTDKTNDTDDWDRENYCPGGSQEGNIARKENDVSKRFNVSTNNIISIAVQVKNEQLTGKTYNLPELVNRMIGVLPKEKKFSMVREAKSENVTEKAAQEGEKGIFDTIKEYAGKFWDTVKDPAVAEIISSVPKIFSAVRSIFKFF
jgi:small GTP-binding protein